MGSKDEKRQGIFLSIGSVWIVSSHRPHSRSRFVIFWRVSGGGLNGLEESKQLGLCVRDLFLVNETSEKQCLVLKR